MEISNFRLIKVIGDSAINWKFKAAVDVTKRVGIFRKKVVEEKEVYKTYAGFWRFSDSGEFTPGTDVEKLQQVLEAKKEKDLQYCL